MYARLWTMVGSAVGLVAIVATELFGGIDVPSWFACALVTVCAVLGGLIGPSKSDRQRKDDLDINVSGAV